MEIWAKSKDFSEGKYLVVRRDGSIPLWPHFVMGARDPLAPRALRVYADIAEAEIGDKAYADSIRALADDFERYRAENGQGDPNAAPHRIDNESVLAAMRQPGQKVERLTLIDNPGDY